jgi:hypothetical protein
MEQDCRTGQMKIIIIITSDETGCVIRRNDWLRAATSGFSSPQVPGIFSRPHVNTGRATALGT